MLPVFSGLESCRAALEKANVARAFEDQPKIETIVREVCDAVRREGDEAVLRFERQFDCPNLTREQLRVAPSEIEAAWRTLDSAQKKALQRAADNIAAFHSHQPRSDWHTISPDGAFLGQRFTPVDRAGLYAPNARAALPSSVLAVAMPAKVAGVREIVLASPPSRDGSLHPVILAAAKIAGIEEIYKVGGAVAIAAMAYGTQTIARVDTIAGPANIYGTLAKKHVFGAVGVDGLYGPSDVVIVCDYRKIDDNLSAQIAADLLAQAEHGADSWACLICHSNEISQQVLAQLQTQVLASPRREILEQSLPNGLVLCVTDTNQMCELANLAAAEHLEIWSCDALGLSAHIRHAGAIFLNTPVPLGDYMAGPSHTLPTGGTARFSGGVDVATFLKRSSLLAAPPSAIAKMADDLEIIALLEDLPGHAAAVKMAANNKESL